MLWCGEYELVRPVGRGGMGDVWAVRHDTLPVDAVVKLVRAGDADAFRAEVRAVAALDHPHVVRILDHGELAGEEVPEGWRGCLWYAMERATDGALPEGAQPWSFVHAVLASLLDALAHAHANGLLHRDLKPGNVLLTRDRPGADPRVLLADFGIVHRLDAAGPPSGSHGSGTPGYMAPEQLEADEQALGPWTDLYALGCLAWGLVSGERLYGRGPIPTVLAAQAEGRIPPLRAGDAPPGTEGFLRTLLERRPDQRFQCAADAAAALATFAGPRGPSTVRVASATLAELETVVLPPSAPGSTPNAPAEGRAPPPAPWCPSWARPTLPPPRDHAVHVAAARSLFGLRRPPPVAREAEREVLWRLLARVHATRRRAAAIVLGPSGSGRSHLLAWLAERATELGAARVLVVHPGDDATSLARRWTRTAALEDAAVARVLTRELPPELLPLGLAVAVPGAPGAPRLSGRERNVALARLLVATSDRPVLVTVDDVHASSDAAGLARDLCEAPAAAGAGALYVVASADETLLANAPAERALVDALPATRVVLAPWSRAASQALLRALLPLEGTLENELVEDGEGYPRWFVDVVTAAVRSNALVPGPAGGFRLADGVDRSELRADPGWVARVDAALLGLDLAAQRSLEVLGALGPRVERRRWARTCAHLGVPASARALEPLVGLRLVAAPPGEPIRVLHPGVVDALRRRAEVGERHVAVQLACAGTAPDPVERALHLVRAGRGEDQVDVLWTTFCAEWTTGSRTRSAAVSSALEALAARGALTPRGEALHAVMRAVTALGGHRPIDALPFVEQAVAAAEASGEAYPRAWALRCRFRYFRVALRVDEGIAAAGACLSACAEAGDDALTADVHIELGNLLLTSGRAPEGIVALDAARALPAVRANDDAWGRTHLSLGAALHQAGRLDEAADAYREALEAFDRAGSVWGRAQTLSDAAILWSTQGVSSAKVRAAHEAAIALFESIGHPSVAFPKVNLGFMELGAGRPDRARPLLDDAAAVFEGRASETVVRAARLRCLAADGDWPGIASELDAIEPILRQATVRGYGVPAFVGEAAALAAAAGHPDLDARLRAVAGLFRS